jgi:rhodanese-related sulfurtransferase
MPSHPSFPDPAEIEIDPEAVAALQQSGTAFRLIDCREPDEWNLTRLPGAELLPLSDFAARYPATLADFAEPIVIHCHHGMRSAKAALFLRQKGFQNVWSMARGIEGWSLEVDPTVPRY